MFSNPIRRTLGERFTALHPQLQTYFGDIPDGHVGVGNGTYIWAGLRCRSLRSVFAVRGVRLSRHVRLRARAGLGRAAGSRQTESVSDDAAVTDYLQGLTEARRADARALIALLSDVTGERPQMWPGSIVGFGSRHYRYESGREGDTMRVGFAARASSCVLYGLLDAPEGEALVRALGPIKRGKGCLYLPRIGEEQVAALRPLVVAAYAHTEG